MDVSRALYALFITINITIIDFIIMRFFSKKEKKTIKSYLANRRISSKIFVFIVMYIYLSYRN